jgi:hypothetical protein
MSQPPNNIQYDRPSNQPSMPTPTQQPPHQSRIGWYLLGCLVVFLVVVAVCVLGGLFLTASPALH